MRIHICSVRQLLRLIQSGSIQCRSCAALISSSYPLPQDKLLPIPFVFCQYDDLDREVPGRSFPREAGAEQFAAFLRTLPAEVTDLYCCCDGGCRRSAAVACSAMLYFGMDDMATWLDPMYEPNALVFRMMCHALDLPMDDEALDYRLESSRQAFRNRIHQS